MKNENPLLAEWLGARIRHFRTSCGFTQEQLAERAGLHRTYIGACERGEKNLTIVNLEVICKHLQVTLKDFFDSEYVLKK